MEMANLLRIFLINKETNRKKLVKYKSRKPLKILIE